MTTVTLTRRDVPDGSVVGWASDVHIPIHHEDACKVMVDAMEWAGTTHIIAGGDILDMHCISRHPKDPERLITQGTIQQEVAPGRWLLDWFDTRPCWYLTGNHEDRWDRFVQENPSLYGVKLENIVRLPGKVLPTEAELRLGNLSAEHGHKMFPKGAGGKYPAQRMLDIAPDQSTIVGHGHKRSIAFRTSRDEHGVFRTRGAWMMGHMSRQEKHLEYAGRHPNWQMGYGVIKVWWEDGRPRFDVTSVEILFDRRNRPYCSLWGKVFR